MKFDKEALWEAIQEIARIAFFGGISALVAVGLNRLAGLPQTETVVIGTFILKFIDKYIHDNPKIKFNGLTDTRILGIN
jgi:hypothetical protein